MAKNYHLKLKGFVGSYDFDSDYVDYVLGKNKDVQVDVLIDSLGGRTDTALSIYHSFKNHGNVHVHFAGMNASAATIASMGAKHITMDRCAFYLVHKCMFTVMKFDDLNSNDLAAFIEELRNKKEDADKIDATVAELYANRCKKTPSELLALMERGGWLTSQEALSWGFIDEVTEFDDDSKAELSPSEIKSLVEMGIPIPGKTESFLSRLFKSWSEHFISLNKTPKPMKKVFTLLCALLSMDALQFQDGKATLTEEQADAIEKHLAKANSDLAAKDAQISTLTQEVASLKKKPGDVTVQVVGEPKQEDDSEVGSYLSTVKSAQELFDLIS